MKMQLLSTISVLETSFEDENEAYRDQIDECCVKSSHTVHDFIILLKDFLLRCLTLLVITFSPHKR